MIPVWTEIGSCLQRSCILWLLSISWQKDALNWPLSNSMCIFVVLQIDKTMILAPPLNKNGSDSIRLVISRLFSLRTVTHREHWLFNARCVKKQNWQVTNFINPSCSCYSALLMSDKHRQQMNVLFGLYNGIFLYCIKRQPAWSSRCLKLTFSSLIQTNHTALNDPTEEGSQSELEKGGP